MLTDVNLWINVCDCINPAKTRGYIEFITYKSKL